MTRVDTLAILQEALSDKELVREIVLYWPNQPLQLIESKIVKRDYQLSFNQKKVSIVAIREEGRAVGQVYPNQLLISFPMLTAVHKDTILVSMIVHANNATSMYKIVHDANGFWKISSNERGKL